MSRGTPNVGPGKEGRGKGSDIGVANPEAGEIKAKTTLSCENI